MTPADDDMDDELFREAMARWASGVTVVAHRTDERVVATTVSAFLSLSLDPPLVLVALGANATVLPFLAPGAPFGLSILSAAQRRLAMIFADPYPVGAAPFTGAVPLVTDALVGLHCTVQEARPAGDHMLITASVTDAAFHDAAGPLIRYRRKYHGLDPG